MFKYTSTELCCMTDVDCAAPRARLSKEYIYIYIGDDDDGDGDGNRRSRRKRKQRRFRRLVGDNKRP